MSVVTRGPAVQRGGHGRGPAINRAGASRSAMPTTADALPALLAEAVVLLRASQFDGVDGDDWVNEGTGGAAFDAEAVGDTPPEFVTSPEPGFVCGVAPEDAGEVTVAPHYEAPHGAAIDITTGPLTVAWRGAWTATAPSSLSPMVAKVTGTPGVDGHGWILFDGSAVGGTGMILANGAAAVAGINAGQLSAAEHLVVARVDRDDDEVTLFVDGVAATPADASSVTTLASTNPIVIGRTTDRLQTARDVVFWDRALTDTEITVDLPAALP